MNINKLQHMVLARMALLAALWLAGCGGGISPGNTAGEKQTAIKASVGVVKTSAVSLSSEVMGTVSPRSSAVVSAQVMGEIRKVMVDEGDIIKKGDLLATIEDRQISARFRQATAGLREAVQGEQTARAGLGGAEASAGLAEATYKRFKSLMDNQSVSRQKFDEVEAHYTQALAALNQAKSMAAAARERTSQAKEALAAAESVLKDTTLTAPYDGKVTARLVDPGDLAAPGTPLLKIEETGIQKVHFVVPESQIQRIGLTDSVSVIIPSVKADPVRGKVIAIDPSADPSTRSFRVKVALDPLPGLRSGIFARVLLPTEDAVMLLIPKTAVVAQGQLTAVFLVGPGNIARFRIIRLGRPIGDDLEVVSGLQTGDRYVIRPDHRIFDGMKVEGA